MNPHHSYKTPNITPNQHSLPQGLSRKQQGINLQGHHHNGIMAKQQIIRSYSQQLQEKIKNQSPQFNPIQQYYYSQRQNNKNHKYTTFKLSAFMRDQNPRISPTITKEKKIIIIKSNKGRDLINEIQSSSREVQQQIIASFANKSKKWSHNSKAGIKQQQRKQGQKMHNFQFNLEEEVKIDRKFMIKEKIKNRIKDQYRKHPSIQQQKPRVKGNHNHPEIVEYQRQLNSLQLKKKKQLDYLSNKKIILETKKPIRSDGLPFSFHNRKVKSSLDSRIDIHHNLEVRPYKKLEIGSWPNKMPKRSTSTDLRYKKPIISHTTKQIIPKQQGNLQPWAIFQSEVDDGFH